MAFFGFGGEKQIGDYILHEKISDGALAQIYQATHIPTGEKVAVKVFNKIKLNSQPDLYIKAQKEISILKKMFHKNIIKLYEIMETGQRLYLVMEFCEGGDLFNYILTRGHLTERQSCKFFHEIIEALTYLHSQHIAHRDIKPENLLLNTTGKTISLKLIDFGISNIYKDEFIRPSCGTSAFAPPELYRGEKYNALLSDIWSAGIVLYAMVFGYLPFGDENEQKNINNIISGNYEIPEDANEDLRDFLSHIIEIDPNKRFNLEQIKNHKWYSTVKDNSRPGIIIDKYKIPIDNRIISVCQAYGYEQEKMIESVSGNTYDNYNSVYYIILNKFIRERFDSISDLFSQGYLDYINDPKNLINYDNNIIEEDKEINNENDDNNENTDNNEDNKENNKNDGKNNNSINENNDNNDNNCPSDNNVNQINNDQNSNNIDENKDINDNNKSNDNGNDNNTINNNENNEINKNNDNDNEINDNNKINNNENNEINENNDNDNDNEISDKNNKNNNENNEINKNIDNDNENEIKDDNKIIDNKDSNEKNDKSSIIENNENDEISNKNEKSVNNDSENNGNNTLNFNSDSEKSDKNENEKKDNDNDSVENSNIYDNNNNSKFSANKKNIFNKDINNNSEDNNEKSNLNDIKDNESERNDEEKKENKNETSIENHGNENSFDINNLNDKDNAGKNEDDDYFKIKITFKKRDKNDSPEVNETKNNNEINDSDDFQLNLFTENERNHNRRHTDSNEEHKNELLSSFSELSQNQNLENTTDNNNNIDSNNTNNQNKNICEKTNNTSNKEEEVNNTNTNNKNNELIKQEKPKDIMEITNMFIFIKPEHKSKNKNRSCEGLLNKSKHNKNDIKKINKVFYNKRNNKLKGSVTKIKKKMNDTTSKKYDKNNTITKNRNPSATHRNLPNRSFYLNTDRKYNYNNNNNNNNNSISKKGKKKDVSYLNINSNFNKNKINTHKKSNLNIKIDGNKISARHIKSNNKKIYDNKLLNTHRPIYNNSIDINNIQSNDYDKNNRGIFNFSSYSKERNYKKSNIISPRKLLNDNSINVKMHLIFKTTNSNLNKNQSYADKRKIVKKIDFPKLIFNSNGNKTFSNKKSKPKDKSYNANIYKKNKYNEPYLFNDKSQSPNKKYHNQSFETNINREKHNKKINKEYPNHATKNNTINYHPRIYKGPIDLKRIITANKNDEIIKELITFLNKNEIHFQCNKNNKYKFLCDKDDLYFEIELFSLYNNNENQNNKIFYFSYLSKSKNTLALKNCVNTLNKTLLEKFQIKNYYNQ